MKDLTQGEILPNVVAMALPIAAGMLWQMLCFLVDLYFVAALGDAALAGVGAAGTLLYVVSAASQVLGAGALALISRATGRGDQMAAKLALNQALLLATLCVVAALSIGYAACDRYVAALTADAAARAAGTTYLRWFLPALALQFVVVTMVSALRATGSVRPATIVQSLTVLLNAVLAPVLIAGWGTGVALGVAGAGLASTLSAAVGAVLLGVYVVKLEKYVAFERAFWRPRYATLRRLLGVGLPAGGELALAFLYLLLVYASIEHLGAAAQAGFGVGARIMQGIFLFALAVAFAAGPMAGQSFGAGRMDRVRQTLVAALLLNGAMMAVAVVFLNWRPELPVQVFTADPEVLAVGSEFLLAMSWILIPQAVVFTCSAVFQGLGNARPALWTAALRLAAFVALATWVTSRPAFELRHLWHVAVATLCLQAVVVYLLLRGRLRQLAAAGPGGAVDAAVGVGPQAFSSFAPQRGAHITARGDR